MIEDDTSKAEKTMAWVVLAFIFVILISSILFGVTYITKQSTEAPYRAVCEANPRIAYASDCEDKEACVERCIEEMRANG